MRWQSVALTQTLLLFVVSTGSGQERSSCAELCRLDPTNVPPECICTGAAGGSGGAGSTLEMTADELLEAQRAYYAERMAPIDNYWVVVESNISPIEEVRYFEKEGTVDEPYFRMIPITELAKRETLANPESGDFERMAAEDPAAVLGAFADAYDIIAASPELNANTGGAASGLLGAFADGLRDAGAGIEEMNQEMEEAGEDAVFDQLGSLFYELWHRPGVRKQARWALYYPDRPTPAQRFGDLFFPIPQSMVAPEWVRQAVVGGAMRCTVVTLDGSFEWESDDGTPYTIERMEWWSSTPPAGGVVDVYAKMQVRMVTAAGGFQRSVIEQESDRYRADGPLIPHRTRRRFSGALTEIVEVVKHLQYNTGPPSQIEIAERTVNSIGAVSGADTSVP
jgi:hypothetical protein